MLTSITLNTIVCNATSEAGHDEVYLIVQPDGDVCTRVPLGFRSHQSMTGGGPPWQVDYTVDFVNDVLIVLYDSDLSVDQSLSEYLVSFDYTPLSIPASVTLTNPNGASYTLYATRNP